MIKIVAFLSIVAAALPLGACVTSAALACTQMPDGKLHCSADTDLNTVGM
jgi:hypothetical protein